MASFADSNQNKRIVASVASTCTMVPSWTLSGCSLLPNIRPPSSSGQPRHTWPQSRRPCLCLCTFRLGGVLLLPSRQDFQQETSFLWQQSPACGSMCIQEAKSSARDLRIRKSANSSLKRDRVLAESMNLFKNDHVHFLAGGRILHQPLHGSPASDATNHPSSIYALVNIRPRHGDTWHVLIDIHDGMARPISRASRVSQGFRRARKRHVR